jgi:hypothetical protein
VVQSEPQNEVWSGVCNEKEKDAGLLFCNAHTGRFYDFDQSDCCVDITAHVIVD